MTDDELLASFERVALPEGGIRHGDHVRLAWIYLRRFPVLEVLARLSTGLAALARRRGNPGRYHETVTWAYVFLIRERMARAQTDQAWDEFVAANPDLFGERGRLLGAYYREETLGSDLARQVFLLPDQGVVPTRESCRAD